MIARLSRHFFVGCIRCQIFPLNFDKLVAVFQHEHIGFFSRMINGFILFQLRQEQLFRVGAVEHKRGFFLED